MATATQSVADLGSGFGQMYVNGKWTDASSGDTYDVINPATEAVFSKIAAGAAQEVDAAVKAARAQFDGGEWSKMPGSQRARLLNRLADLLERDKEYLAKLESATVGKPLFEPTMLDIPMTIDTVRYFAGWADKIEGRTIPTAGVFGRPAFSYTVREPVGVIGAITPWNAPTMIAAWKFAPALAAGCTMVMKPSEESPLTTLHIAKLMEEAGIPAGVFNVVTGIGEVAGAALARHPGIDKISFTGSPEVGREIQKVAADGFKRVTLEMGGKTPHIVLADADLAERHRRRRHGAVRQLGADLRRRHANLRAPLQLRKSTRRSRRGCSGGQAGRSVPTRKPTWVRSSARSSSIASKAT